MKRALLFISATFVYTGILFAQKEENKSNKLNNEFGIHAGSTTGLGISYRRWVGRVGAQVTALPIKSDNSTFVSAAATALFSIKENDYVRSYLYLGNHFVINDDKTKHSIGFGPGFSFGKYVAFNIMSGYGVYDVGGEFNIFPTGEIGLYVKF